MIDILLPVYNGEKYLKEQIESICTQTYSNIRLIIRDDNSNDKSLNIIEEYAKKDSRIYVLKDKIGNVGLVKNIEILLKNSTSEYIMLADQDDVWLKEKVEKLFLKIREESKEIPVLIHCNCFITNKNLKIKGRFLGDKVKNYDVKDLFFKYYVQGASCIFNKKLKELSLPFVNSVYIHDRYLHILTEIFGKRIYLDECLMYYRQHEKNTIGRKSIFIKILRNIKYLPKNFYEEKDRLLFSEIIKTYEIKEKLFEYYIFVTNNNINKIKRYKILRKNFKLRWKEKFLFWIR